VKANSNDSQPNNTEESPRSEVDSEGVNEEYIRSIVKDQIDKKLEDFEEKMNQLMGDSNDK
jgi:hypothetical protein